MASISLPAHSSAAGNLRPLNILRDLPQVADLIELCFANNMDSEGHSYIRQMRHASKDASFMRWASNAIEGASMPLSGFVWEQDGHIIGNASLVPFRHKGKRIYLIANVATHPDHRRKGIAHALTERALTHARQRGANALWLHVRADNPGAVQMYRELGFVERAQRITWRAKKGTPPPAASLSHSTYAPDLPTITKRFSRFWPQQRTWLKRLHPEELSWYRSWSWNSLKPGLWSWLYRLFVEFDLRQWAVQKDGQLQGVLAWMPTLRSAPLWLACDSYADPESITTLLIQARYDLRHQQNLKMEHPANMQEEAIQAAGFENARTLIWMRAKGAT
ncbi:MAG: GNAT family N-acetyltransferase [Anaerolineales bacterium]